MAYTPSLHSRRETEEKHEYSVTIADNTSKIRSNDRWILGLFQLPILTVVFTLRRTVRLFANAELEIMEKEVFMACFKALFRQFSKAAWIEPKYITQRFKENIYLVIFSSSCIWSGH